MKQHIRSVWHISSKNFINWRQMFLNMFYFWNMQRDREWALLNKLASPFVSLIPLLCAFITRVSVCMCVFLWPRGDVTDINRNLEMPTSQVGREHIRKCELCCSTWNVLLHSFGFLLNCFFPSSSCLVYFHIKFRREVISIFKHGDVKSR